jgi:hypothetical protein
MEGSHFSLALAGTTLMNAAGTIRGRLRNPLAGSHLFANVESARRVPMRTTIQHYSSYLPLLVVVLPAAVFGLYIVYLVVPEVVHVVAPAVVEKIVGSL